MPEITREMVVEALSKVNDPELHRDLVSLGMIRNVAVSDGAVKFTLALTTMACPLKSKMQEDCKTAVMRIPGVREVTIDLTADTPRNARPASGKKVGDIVLQDMLPTVKNAIAVASGKGGVGKSTVSVNIAAALAMEGARVGLLDADIYGPSIPIMMGVTEQPEITDSEEIIPIRKYGIELMSIGFVIPEEQSVIWRGPMVAKMLQQFLSGVKWGELDYLIVDLPPGTGDAQLTLTQSVPLAGGLIV
ncbi:MAG TPA: P-loop NTPase, partial [Candidatus Latescibacteria bacterium]|nr:P-loop NTPase [Candidatus Latescibacterota bacterium]